MLHASRVKYVVRIWYVDEIVNTGIDEDEAEIKINFMPLEASLAIPWGQDTGVGSSSVMCIIQEPTVDSLK